MTPPVKPKLLLAASAELEGLADAMHGVLARSGRQAEIATASTERPGDLARAAARIRPDIGLIADLGAPFGRAHEADAWISDFAGLVASINPGGAIVFNADAAPVDNHDTSGLPHLVTYGVRDPEADVSVLRVTQHPRCSCVKVGLGATTMAIKVNRPGSRWVSHALAILTTAHMLGADLAEAGLALASLKPAAGHGRVSKIRGAGGTCWLIDDSAEADPLAVIDAIEVLGLADVKGQGRRIAVLGDTPGLGFHSGALRTSVARVLEENHVDIVIAVGLELAEAVRALPVETEWHAVAKIGAAIDVLKDLVRDGDVILVKGGQARGLERLVKALTRAGGRAGRQAA